MDKTFLLKAIEEVYKNSIIEEDEKMKTKSIEMLGHELLSETDRLNLKEKLNDIDGMHKTSHYTCYIDGAVDSQSKESSAAVSFVIYLEDEVYYKFKYKIPNELSVDEITEKTSSHMAEYQSLIILLRTLSSQVLNPSSAEITVYTDSKILKGQYYAEYRVTNKIQRDLRRTVFGLTKNFKDVNLKWIPREENIIANDLAQELI